MKCAKLFFLISDINYNLNIRKICTQLMDSKVVDEDFDINGKTYTECLAFLGECLENSREKETPIIFVCVERASF